MASQQTYPAQICVGFWNCAYINMLQSLPSFHSFSHEELFKMLSGNLSHAYYEQETDEVLVRVGMEMGNN